MIPNPSADCLSLDAVFIRLPNPSSEEFLPSLGTAFQTGVLEVEEANTDYEEGFDPNHIQVWISRGAKTETGPYLRLSKFNFKNAAF